MSIGDYLVFWLALFCWGANFVQGWDWWFVRYLDRRDWRRMKRLGKRRPIPALQRRMRS